MPDTQTSNDSMRSPWQPVCLFGLFSAILFLTSLVSFAAMRTDGYTHGTKAISELGAINAPNALAFNLLGFVIPGALTVLFAIALLKLAKGKLGRAGPMLLVACGLSFILAGLFPVDLSDRDSLTSIAHAIGASFAGLFWGLSLFWIGPGLKRGFKLGFWGTMTPWFILFLIANFVWQGVWQTTGTVLPGWGQRIAFGGHFTWLAITSSLIFMKTRTA